MKEQFKDYFYFTRGEKNGIIILLIILLLLIAVPYATSIFVNNEPTINKEFEKEIKLFSQSLKEIEEPAYNNRLNQYIIERYDSLKLFHFNPNTTSAENFEKLGLTNKQIKTIINYLNKGGKFYIKDDFRRIYGIRQQQYQILKPYILLPEKEYFNDETANSNIEKYPNDSLFVFDPNKATESEFKKLGLSDKQINTIKNYLNKGGSFYKKEDFKKIYGISEDQYNRLEPYIFIKNEKEKLIPDNNQKIELNSATIKQLTELKGIGDYTAKAIINYRKRLGGYVKVDQLLEIKSLNQQYFDSYKNTLIVDPDKLQKLSLNFAEISDLTKHPYLNYEEAAAIIKYRSKYGPYQNLNQLLEKKILEKNTYDKIKPYFSLN